MIRSQTPHIEKRRKPKYKRVASYKENKRRQYPTDREAEPYAMRSLKRQLSSNRTATIREKRIYTRATPKLRAQYKKLRRRRNRVKNKKLGIMKTCTHCLISKAISDFDLLKNKDKSKTLRRPYCYLCRKLMNAEAYQERKQAHVKGKTNGT